jgi:hypothetical protein
MEGMPGGHPSTELKSEGSGPSTPENSSKQAASNSVSPSTPPQLYSANSTASMPVNSTGVALVNSAQSNKSSQNPKFKKDRKLGPNGEKRNFYNPPGKVMRHLAQQSYYDNFYGNQGQFYNLKQKFKTQMCKHFLDQGECPLSHYCQFAHGPEELRQPNDVSFDQTR